MTSPAREDASKDASLEDEEELGRNDADAQMEEDAPNVQDARSVEDEEGQANGDQDGEQSEVAQGDDSLSPDHCTIYFILASF